MVVARGAFKLQSLCCLLRGRAGYFRASAVQRVGICQPAANQQKRPFSLSTVAEGNRSDEKMIVHFINRDNEKLTAVAKEGESLLDVVINHNLDIDGFGACEGTLACSTCHVIFDKDIFGSLDEIADEEMDMLELAFGLTSTSRLGCQICLKKSLDGITVKVPKDVINVRKSVDAKGQ
ncbi:ferredoxin 1b isoform X2 [Scyliorhinus canicula]|uniref:ferredoxin 1b isoform X2 n=1 Tax=Scyliorhinus canicula TaxID=7830 RepID=UPI0018F40F6E|nr:ferredoxin 1b isoform X2 [Scyliorhinus canicula]